MKTKLNTRFLSLLLAVLILLPTMMFVLPVFAEVAAPKRMTYVLKPDSMEPFNSGAKLDGETETAGTDNFFTLHYGSSSRIDGSSKTFEDGFEAKQRINFGGKYDPESSTKKNVISFTVQDSAKVKIWWVAGGAKREFGIFDEAGNIVDQTNAQIAQNALCISELNISEAGTYYLGGIQNNNYIFKVAVTTKEIDRGPRCDWSTIADPVINSVVTDDDGIIHVNVKGVVHHNGADRLTVDMIQNGKVVSTASSTSYKDERTFRFSPIESGDYTFVATLSRKEEAEVKTSDPYDCAYTLPLASPYITNIKNHGDGKVTFLWNPVREATSYLLSLDGADPITLTDRQYTVENLSIGSHTIQITAVSLTGNTPAEAVEFNATAEAELGWNYVVYGPSAKTNNNYQRFDEDGNLVLESVNNGGKLQPTGADGLGFYYTAVPADQNFTFRARISVNEWVFTNGQEGFGLMVTDHVPSTDYNGSDDFWTNQYMAVATKIEYRYEDTEDSYILYTNDSGIGTKYSMKLGIGTISKIGINQSHIDRTALGETGLIVGQYGNLKTVVQTLDPTAGLLGKEAGTYNMIGNYFGNTPEGTFEDAYVVTEMILEIQKNNTGYFITYYKENAETGELIPVRQVKNYVHDALEQFDKDYVYLGMFAARYANVTFKDVELTFIDEELDAPAEPTPITLIKPAVTVTSSTTTSSTDYELVVDTNLDGTLEVLLNNCPLVLRTDDEGTEYTQVNVKKFQRFSAILDLSEYGNYGENDFRIFFTPDPNQKLEPFTKLENANPVVTVMNLIMYKGNYHRKTIYVSPNGLYSGTGSKENPFDIVTAVNSVVPGQTIVLMEGTYVLKEGLKIQRGMNGREDAVIRMIADPEAKSRPVIDFVHEGTGILHGGNWWYFEGFDVINSLDGQKGFQVAGNNNVLNNINTYHNGNTGIQISRYSGVDLTKDQWPANNLILNCTSYGNADKGYEDADGFAAKLTIGEGNVFDGCVAYNNADDGWDLFAKVATGPIGSVVIRNCVAYGNGYLEDGTLAGNGNGFKLGGDSLTGYHQLINCIAFNNKQKGIDSNSCPDIIVENCISYNNGSYNVAFYTNTSANTDFSGTGIISFKDENAAVTHALAIEKGKITNVMIGDNLKSKGNQDDEKFINSSCYYWNGKSCASDAAILSANIFESVEFKGITRNADGTINMNGFLALSTLAPDDAGTTGDKTPSPEIELEADLPHDYSDSWVNTDSTVHWQECECGDRFNIGSHTFEYVIDQEPTATQPGYKHNECTVCGFKRPQIEIPPTGEDEEVDPPVDGDDNPPAGDENPPVENPPVEEPTVDEVPVIVDFASFWEWLFYFISKFFTSLFGG